MPPPRGNSGPATAQVNHLNILFLLAIVTFTSFILPMVVKVKQFVHGGWQRNTLGRASMSRRRRQMLKGDVLNSMYVYQSCLLGLI